MTNPIARPNRVLMASRLLVGARVIFVLWVLGWIAFGVLALVHATSELLSGVGAIICTLFAAGFGLRVVASRMMFREFATPLPVDETIASRSRRTQGQARVR